MKLRFYLVLVFSMFCLFDTTLVNAETKIITAVGSYTMGEGETMLVAKERAVEQAMRIASEQAGVYVESYSQMNKFQLTTDEINVLSRSVITINDRKFEDPKFVSGGFVIQVTITAIVDSDSIASLRNRLKEKSAIETLKQIQADYVQAQNQIEELKQQLQSAKTEQEKKQVVTEIALSEQSFTAKQLAEKAYKYASQRDYTQAISTYTQAIALSSGTDQANYYNQRASLYRFHLNQCNMAIADYSQAIAVSSGADQAKHYDDRAQTYYIYLHQPAIAISDYNQAIAVTFGTKQGFYYTKRASIYTDLNQYDMAIADYNKAIALNSGVAQYYVERGILYRRLGQLDMAIADCTKAIALNSGAEQSRDWYPRAEQAKYYRTRGYTYEKLKQLDMAIADYNKAAFLNPTDFDNSSALIELYDELKQDNLALAECDRLIALDPKHYNYYNLKANYLVRKDRKSEAIDVWRSFIANASNKAQIGWAKQAIVNLGGNWE